MRALNSCEFRSGIVWECFTIVFCSGQMQQGDALLSPWSTNNEGNEVAHELANATSASDLIGPQRFCGITFKHRYISIMSWAQEKNQKRWARLPYLGVSKLTLLYHNRSPPTSCSWRQLKQVTGLATALFKKQMGILQIKSVVSKRRLSTKPTLFIFLPSVIFCTFELLSAVLLR